MASTSLELPKGIVTKTNNSPELSKYFNESGAPYTSAAQVISEVKVRYIGQVFNVNKTEWCFKNGTTDVDLEIKVPDLDLTAGNIAVDASGFDGNLSPADTNVQKALEAIDSLVIAQEIVTDASLYFDSTTSSLRGNVGQSRERFKPRGDGDDIIFTAHTFTRINFITVNGQVLSDELTQWNEFPELKKIVILEGLEANDIVVVDYNFLITA